MVDDLPIGRAVPKLRGGNRRSIRSERLTDFLMSAIEETPDMTLAELRDRLIEEWG